MAHYYAALLAHFCAALDKRSVTEFWREHTSYLQRQIHPSTTMAVRVSIGEHQPLRSLFGAGAEPGGQVHMCRWITVQWRQL